jgi:hypothetical protein
MKKSKAITLVLVTGLLGCNKPQQHNRLYMRTDSASSYTHGTSGFYGYYIFRPYGMYYGGRGSYIRQGYSNSSIHSSVSARSISRGGFGRTGGFHASSSS